jgi:hypothetical protein
MHGMVCGSIPGMVCGSMHGMVRFGVSPAEARGMDNPAAANRNAMPAIIAMVLVLIGAPQIRLGLPRLVRIKYVFEHATVNYKYLDPSKRSIRNNPDL